MVVFYLGSVGYIASYKITLAVVKVRHVVCPSDLTGQDAVFLRIKIRIRPIFLFLSKSAVEETDL